MGKTFLCKYCLDENKLTYPMVTVTRFDKETYEAEPVKFFCQEHGGFGKEGVKID